MEGEKSDVGIVVRKLAGKAAKASETARVAVASFDSKGKDLCEARNHERRTIEGNHVLGRSRGAKKCVDPGNEHKEKPSGASTGRSWRLRKLQTTHLKGKENEHGGTRARQSNA